MRDLLVLGAMIILLPLSFKSPFRAYLLWGWAGLIALPSYLYGFMIDFPYALGFALITLIGVLVRGDSEGQKYKNNRTSILFLLFVSHGLLCALFAYPGLVRNWELFTNLAKTVLFCLLMHYFATSRYRIHAIILMFALAMSFHGVLDGLKFLVSAGGHNARGIIKFGDNNQFALVLVMTIPILYYLYQYSEKLIARCAFGISAMLTLLAVVATNSRGGLAGLTAVAVWIVFKSRRKVAGIFFVVTCVFLILYLAPESWTDRMQTIQAADEDASFMGRVTAWKVNSAIALAHPFVGGGFRVVESAVIWDQFKFAPGLLGFIETPMLSRSGVASHSIWFEVMGDLGFVGFFIFIAILVNAFVTIGEIRSLAHANGPTNQWAVDLADMLGAALTAYMVCGSLLSAAYFESLYIVAMLLEVVKTRLKTQSVLQRPAQ